MTSLRLLLAGVADDEAERIVDELERAGVTLETLCVAGEDALRNALADGGWQAIVVGGRMPRSVAELGFRGAVVVVARDAAAESVVEAIKAGAHDYVLASDLRRLPAAIAQALVEVEAEHARRGHERRLNETARLEAVAQLAGGVAHDFNNLLLVIRGYSSVLQASLGDEPARADLGEIVEATDRASALTRQLLVFARRSSFAPRVLDVAEVVRSLESPLRQIAGASVELGVVVDDVAPAFADPAQIELVLRDLVANARDAVGSGNVNVDVSEARIAEGETDPVPAGTYVRLTVEDDGAGIPDEDVPHIFEPFFLKRPGVGSGLGLATVHAVVAGLGGGIGVRTASGEGTAISVYLPVAAPA